MLGGPPLDNLKDKLSHTAQVKTRGPVSQDETERLPPEEFRETTLFSDILAKKKFQLRNQSV